MDREATKGKSKMKMFYLANTMDMVDGWMKIISAHRTMEAAEEADRKLNRAIKRSSGQSSYLPTRIIEANKEDIEHGWVK